MLNSQVRLLMMSLLFISLMSCSADSSLQGQKSSANISESANPSKLETLQMSSQCGPALASQWVSSQQQLEKLFQATQGMMISPSPQSAPQIDFTLYGVLFLSMGQQRTGGYAIRLAQETMKGITHHIV